MPQYSRKQYSLKQYGKYKTIDSREFYLTQGEFRRARIRVGLKSGHYVWVYQHSPIQIPKKVNKIRAKTNTGDIVYLQSIDIPGQHPIRVRTNLSKNKNLISSQLINIKGGA